VDECWSGSFANLAGNLKRFRPGQRREPRKPPLSVLVQTEKEEEKW